MTAPFAEFKEIIENMSMSDKQALIQRHKDYGILKEQCRARGYIEIMPNMGGIKVLKNKPEVKRLKELVMTLTHGKYNWVDKKKKATQ